ncbi:hypothetical protein DQT32_04560 [Salmonella enterica subsp. enterica serovar Braenderup]|nr:hypothetical protein [Salmonella enterica subsp. enterica serovar Braenderup]
MLMKFFLTMPFYLYPEKHQRYGRHISTSTVNVANPSVSSKSKQYTTTFEDAIEQFARSAATNGYGGREETMFIVNLDDTATFQLETLALVEGTYCTYDLGSKLIGFGGMPWQAINAAKEKDGSSLTGSAGFKVVNETSVMFDFSYHAENADPHSYELCVPDAFYETILNELIPYIDFVKMETFKKVNRQFLRFVTSIDNYIDNYYENRHDAPQILASMAEIILAIKMFIDDDPVLIKNKDFYPTEYAFMAALCRRFQVLTNETF